MRCRALRRKDGQQCTNRATHVVQRVWARAENEDGTPKVDEQGHSVFYDKTNPPPDDVTFKLRPACGVHQTNDGWEWRSWKLEGML